MRVQRPESAAPRSKRGSTSSPRGGLGAYRAKRDFKRTPEPSGGRPGKGQAFPLYVIQLHRASHVHYDLRLEEDGVLKSWAIPKTPPLKAGEKRLAVATEDHPLDYAFFEGTIPEGEYGAGTVAVWDRGVYESLEATPTKRIVNIRGRRLKGDFALIKLPAKDGQKDKNWLFFKVGAGGSRKDGRKSP